LPTNSLAVVSLIFGVLCWVALPVVGSLVAIFCGHLARREIREAGGASAGDRLAVGGLLLGYLHLATVVIGLLVAVLFLGGLAAVLAAVGAFAAAG
jgi:hypothetical protein